jgi:hypothetical protein
MTERKATVQMGSQSSQSFLFLYRTANVVGVFVPLKRVEWAGGRALGTSVSDSRV